MSPASPQELVSEVGAADLVADLQALARRLGTRRISRSTWMREAGGSEHFVLKHFDSWNGFVEAAGLEPDRTNRRIDDDELLGALRDAFLEVGEIVPRIRLSKVCRYSDDVYAKRWGRWSNVIAQLVNWLKEHDSECPLLAQLPGVVASAELAAPRSSGPGLGNYAPRSPESVYGAFLNFRGLQHAPINEQGVVFLFGMVAFDLGYVVEGIGTGYPDCEAKRCISASGDVWERVRLEFEYKSRNFLSHGHDPAECDMLVCWEHNWFEGPIDVLELRTTIAELAS